jgi:hypothetical protein
MLRIGVFLDGGLFEADSVFEDDSLYDIGKEFGTGEQLPTSFGALGEFEHHRQTGLAAAIPLGAAVIGLVAGCPG